MNSDVNKYVMPPKGLPWADGEQCNNRRKSEGRGGLLRGIHIVGVVHDEHDMLPSTTMMKGSDARGRAQKGTFLAMPPR